MQAIGSLATLVQIVVASSHAHVLGARRGPQSTTCTVRLDNRSANPIFRLTTTLDVPLRHPAAAIRSSCMYLIALSKRQLNDPPRLQGLNRYKHVIWRHVATCIVVVAMQSAHVCQWWCYERRCSGCGRSVQIF
jgi:hypothetical protein